MRDNEALIRMLEGLNEDLKSNEYRITIIGEFSSGKSTFINALLGRDILPHGVEETTAAVTYIHNVPVNSPKVNTVEVISRDSSMQPQILNLSASPSALIDYVTAKSTSKDVVKEIAEVHIYVPFIESGEQVVLIDTPGLNGVKEGMRDITYREIHRSHANVCLFHIKGASQSDLDFIEKFYKNGTPFFFVLNQIDALNEETPEERIEKFTLDVKDNIVHSKELPENVFGISALKALTSRDRNIKRLYSDDKSDLTSDDRSKLLDSSRIELFEKALYDFVSTGEIEKNFLENIKESLENILNTAKQDAQAEIDLLEAKTSDLPEKTVLERQRQVVEKSIAGNKEIIKNKLSARMGELEKETIISIRGACEAIAEEAEKIVSQWQDMERAEKEAKSGKVVGLINDRVNYQRTVVVKPILEKKFDRIYSDLVDTISGFVPLVQYSRKTSSWNISLGKEEFFDTSKLDRINAQIRSATAERSKAEAERKDVQSKADELERKKREIDISIRNNERSRQYDLNRLGSAPSYRTWDVEVPKRKRFLFITWQSTTTEERNNQAEIDEYYQEKDRINSEYDAKASSLRTVRNNVMRSLDNLDVQAKDLMIRKIDSELVALERRKQQTQEELDFLRKNAKKKFLDKLKSHARTLIAKSITPNNGELYLALREETSENIRRVEQSMRVKLEDVYQNILDDFRKKLSLMICKIEEKADLEGTKRRIAFLADQIKKLELYISQLRTIKLN